MGVLHSLQALRDEPAEEPLPAEDEGEEPAEPAEPAAAAGEEESSDADSDSGEDAPGGGCESPTLILGAGADVANEADLESSDKSEEASLEECRESESEADVEKAEEVKPLPSSSSKGDRRRLPSCERYGMGKTALA